MRKKNNAETDRASLVSLLTRDLTLVTTDQTSPQTSLSEPGFKRMKKWILSLLCLTILGNASAQTLIYEDVFSGSGDGTFNSTSAFSSGTAPNNTDWRYTEFDVGFGVSWDVGGGEARLQNEYGVNHDWGANMLYKAGDGYYTAPGGLYEQSASFTTTFKNNTEILEWTFNFYASEQPTGLTNGGAGFLGGAFVLGLNSPTLESAFYTTEGYAVTFGDASGAGNYAKLVRVEGGTTDGNTAVSNQPKYTFFNWNGTNTTTCIVSDDQTLQGNDWYSVKVQYNPTDDEWRLYVRNTGGTKEDPQLLDANDCKGANIDGTYTNTNLPIMGMYSCQPDVPQYTSVEFDNIRIKLMTEMLACNSSTGLCGAYAPCSTPTLSLSSTTGDYCLNSTVNISGNTFTNASQVNITHDGNGGITPSSSSSSPFSFTYTPDPTDQGNTVTITVETSDEGCGTVTETYTANFYNIPDVDPSLSSPTSTICESAGLLDLTTFETGTTGGTWSGTGVSGTNFDPSFGNQTLTYTVGTSPCEESSNLTITVVPDVDPALTQTDLSICEANGLLDLTTFEAATTGGTWSGTGVSGTDFDPSVGSQTLTYTVGTTPCEETNNLNINVIPDVYPSLSSPSTTICESSGILDLTTFETGTTGGTWSGTGVSGGNFDPSVGNQTLTYTVGTSPCEESSNLTITVAPDVDPALTQTDLSICEANGLLDLTTFEAGTTGGTWSGTGVSGTDFDPSVGSQTLTYTVGTNPCKETSNLNITVIPDVDPSLSSPSTTICESSGILDLTTFETGTTGGSWSGTGVSGGNFDPSVGSQTVTYTVGSSPCDESNTFTITVNADVDPTLSTATTTICEAAGTIDLTTFESGTTGGTWSGTGVSGNNFDPSVGSQTVTYTVGISPCEEMQNLTITVEPDVDPTLTVGSISVCANDGLIDLTAYENGTTGGNWTGTGVSGSDFDPSAGTQTLTYSVGTGICVESNTLTVTVDPVDDASFTYPSATFCITGINPVATITGTTGGTFSTSSPGILVSTSTGEIDLASSGLGSFWVYYNTTSAGNPCPSIDSVSVTVTSAPSASFNFDAAVYCQNESDPIISFGSGASAGVFSATPTGLAIDVPSGAIDLASSTPGTYMIYNTIAASGGCAMAIDSVSVTINEIYMVAENASICSGDSIFLGGFYQSSVGTYNDTLSSALGCDSIIQTTLSLIPEVTSSTALNICAGDSALIGGIYYSSDGIYNDTLTASTGCDSILQVSLTVLSEVITTISASICQGDSILLGGSYQNSGGTYNDTLTATGGCDSIVQTNLTIISLPITPLVSDTTICLVDGNPTMNATGASGTVYWHSDAFGTDTLGTGISYTPNITSSGTTTIYVSQEAGGCSSGTVAVNIDALNSDASIGSSPDPAIGYSPLTVDFTGSSTTTSIYNWDLGDGTSSTDQNPSNTFTTGTYTVILETSNGGCLAYDTIIVIVEDEPVDIEVPNGFSPNGDGVNDFFVIPGLDQYPDNELIIFNRWGNEVFQSAPYNSDWDGSTTNKTLRISGDKVTDGTYFFILNLNVEGIDPINGFIELRRN
ncbi:MAG: gliding motility-associated C-terminal domain-containing protein [Flavobacteriales bacterium]|nr:gliding motility-associated C-terminal domain-containing protein [Flavobacteriales bacterium]